MRKSKKLPPDVMKMIRESHEKSMQQHKEASLGLAPDLDWDIFSNRFKHYYDWEPMQYEDIGYHDFMMNLKDLWLDMQPAQVESTKLKDMLIGLKTRQVRRDYDPFDDDEFDDEEI